MEEELRKKKLRRQNIISICILLGGVALSFLFFGPRKIQSQETGSNEAEPAVLVKTLIAGEEKTKVAILEKTATFSSGSQADAIAEYSGRVASVAFEVGVYVKEGQELVNFDQSIDQNFPKINYESALKTLELSRQNLSKTQELNKENLELAKNARKVAQLQLEQEKKIADNSDQIKIVERNLENAKDLEDQAEKQAELSLNGAKLQLSQAEANLQNAKVSFEKTIVKAPISGLVVSKKVKEGDYISNGKVVAQVVGGGKLQATISLSRAQIERVKSGDDVSITIDGQQSQGEIVSFSPVANSQNERYDVLIKSVDDLSEKANRSGKIQLKLYLDEKKADAFFVPLEAVNIGQKKTVVFVVVDGKIASREVETGEMIGAQIEIVKGLSKGEEVVIENSRNIQQGQSVKSQ